MKAPRGQLSMFDGEPSAPADVPPAVANPEDTAVAECLPIGVRFGTSSWAFPGWAGLVYGAPATSSELAWRGLRAYASHPLLGAVGIDRSYYAPVPPGDFHSYRAQVDSAGRTGMRWLVKVGRDITQPWSKKGRNPMFLNGDLAVSGWVAPASEALGRDATIHLVQFSPMGRGGGDPERFAERLRVFLAALLPHGRVAVELRDGALLGPAYVAALLETGAQHCINLLPEMPGPLAQAEVLRANGVPDGAPLVIRWLRSGGLDHDAAENAYDPYDQLVAPADALIEDVAGLIRRAIAAGSPEVVTIVDNKAEGSAPLTVSRLAGAVVGTSS